MRKLDRTLFTSPILLHNEAGPVMQVPDISTIYRTKTVNLIKTFYEKSKPEVNFKQKLEMNEAAAASYADW